MSKRKAEEIKIIEIEVRIWLTSGSHIDMTAEYETGELEDLIDQLNTTTGRVYLMKDINEGLCLTLKAEAIAGYEWL